MSKKKKYYAVARGRMPGIYDEWYGPRGAEVQIRGFPGARYKGFISLEEAKTWLDKLLEDRFLKKAPDRQADPPGSRKKSANRPLPQKEKTVTIYTDGGCLNNPGPGGYGAVIIDGEKRREFSGGVRLTTNNRMELTACIVALKAIPPKSSVILYSDSKYVVDSITKGWAKKWRKNNWMRTKDDPAANPDLWDELLHLAEINYVQFKWVKGHVGNQENERCDELANQAAIRKGLPPDKGYLGGPSKRD